MALVLGGRCKKGHFMTSKNLRNKIWQGKIYTLCLTCKSENSRRRYAIDPEYRERRLQSHERSVEKQRKLNGKQSMKKQIENLMEDLISGKAEIIYLRRSEETGRYHVTIRECGTNSSCTLEPSNNISEVFDA